MRVLAAILAVLLLPGPGWAQATLPAPPRPARAAPPPAPHTSPSPPHRATPGHAKPKPKPKAPARHGPAPAAAPAPAPAPEAEKPAEPQKGTNTGLPLPRFAALRSEEVNFRSGPGARYPIEWVYKRRDLPVQIEREFEVWRLVRDSEGVKGWVHQATLAGRRTAVVIGGEQALRDAGNDKAAVVARLKPGVIIRLRSCEAGSNWCEAQAGDYRGWIKRSEIWGTLPGEAIQ